MNDSKVDPTAEKRFYRVDVADGLAGCIHCGHDAMYTITFADGAERIEIGQSWGDQELAQDICDLMNMAFEFGKESK